MTPEVRNQIVQLFGADTIVSGPTSPSRAIAVHPVDTGSVVSAVLSLFAELPSRKAEWVIGGLAGIETEKLDTIMRAPVVSDPLVQSLIAFESRAILRASDSLPNNTVSVVKENRAFVEAFLVGANHEMNNELRWREFPTGHARHHLPAFLGQETRARAIRPATTFLKFMRWTGQLGSNYPAHDVDRKESLVVLVRGDLIRKYGQILVTLNRATATSYVHGEGTNFAPIFAGQFTPDICYYGFDVDRESVLADKARHFFVLYEVPGRVRFGLDVVTAAVRRDRFAFRKAALAFPLTTSAAMPRRRCCRRTSTQAIQPPALASKWDELSWAHMQLDTAGYINVEQILRPSRSPELLELQPRFRLDCAKLLAEANRRHRARHKSALMTDILGRARGRVSPADAARLASHRELIETIRRDLEAPPPLLLLPLRLEYRVVETNVPVRVSGNVRELVRNDPAISIDAPENPALGGVEGAHADSHSWRLDATTVRFNTQRQIWFRWFPDDAFALRGIAPPTEQELAAIARFDSACAGKPWHAVDDAVVVSAWQTLSREVEAERALHLIRHRGDSGDPDHLDVTG